MGEILTPDPHPVLSAGRGGHLVIGANGGIGSALYSRLKASVETVWGTTQRDLNSEDPQLFYLNLLDSPADWRFPNASFDVVYLAAGICRMALCESDPAGTSKVNIDGMTRLARFLSESGAFVVFLSTNQVFSGNDAFVTENAPYRPLNEYGRQKAVVEEFIKQHCPRSAIVRLTKVVEPNMAMINQWVERLLNNKPIEAFNDMMLAPVSLSLVVDVLVQVGAQKKPGCYQISGAEDVSYLVLAQYLASCLNRSQSLVQSVSALDKGIKKTFLPRFTTLSCSSTIALCGLIPPHFSEVIKECFQRVAAANEYGVRI